MVRPISIWGVILALLLSSIIGEVQATAAGLPGPPPSRSSTEPMGVLSALWQASWRIGALFLLWGALYAPLILLRRESFQEPENLGFRLYVECAGAGTLLLAGWILVHFIDQRPFVSLGFSAKSLGQEVLLGAALGVGKLVLTLAPLWVGGWLHPAERDNVPSWSVLPLAALTVLCNVVTQEVLVRGYILQTLRTYLGTATALIGSSLLFSAFHYGTAKGALLPHMNLFLSGLVYGYAYLETGNLWAPISLHWAWNLLLGPVLGLTVSGLRPELSPLYYGWSLLHVRGPALVTGGAFGIEGGLAATFANLALLLALYLLDP